MKTYRQAVGAVLLNSKNEIFVGERIDTPNAWQMPQGGVESNEDTDIAIFRELKEEIGTDNASIIFKTPKLKYDLPRSIQKTTWDGKYVGQEQIWYILRYNGTDAEINLNYFEYPEFSQWKWCNQKELLESIVNFKYDMYVQIINYINKHIN